MEKYGRYGSSSFGDAFEKLTRGHAWSWWKTIRSFCVVFSFWLLEDGRVEPDRHHCWYWIAACHFCLESAIVDAHRHHSINNNSRLKWFSNVWFRFCPIKHTRLPSYSAWLLLFLLVKLLISFWREDSSPMTNLVRFIVANQWIFGHIRLYCCRWVHWDLFNQFP